MTDVPLNRQHHQIDALLADLHREHALVNLIIRGCIDYRWAISDDERAIAQAMIFNAFEAYLIEQGMAIADAGEFCDQHLDALMNAVLAEL